MKVNVQALRPARLAVLAAVASLMPLAAAQAQGLTMAEAQARYKEDIQRCSTLTDPEAQRTCRREAGAALQEARRNRLVNPNGDTQANAAARCARLPAERRAECERLMTDSSARTLGSVSGGGVLRELTIEIPADQATGSGYTTQPAPSYPHSGQTGTTSGTQAVPGYGTPAAPGGYTQPAPATQPYGAVPVR
ncbi:MAG TPA: hypothetical protein VKZ52_07900 [Burkholderiaceae bacterium]|nr:hypothetical protein [Burkholderiaceae bacterium]